MKRWIYNILLFVGVFIVLLFAYRNIFEGDILPVILTLVFFALYGAVMGLGEVGTHRLKKYEYKAVRSAIEISDHPKIFGAALLSLLPIFFCIGLASAFPIMVYEVWFITVLPCLIVSYFPIKEICDVYRSLTRRRVAFTVSVWAISAFLSIFSQCIAQSLI